MEAFDSFEDDDDAVPRPRNNGTHGASQPPKQHVPAAPSWTVKEDMISEDFKSFTYTEHEQTTMPSSKTMGGFKVVPPLPSLPQQRAVELPMLPSSSCPSSPALDPMLTPRREEDDKRTTPPTSNPHQRHPQPKRWRLGLLFGKS